MQRTLDAEEQLKRSHINQLKKTYVVAIQSMLWHMDYTYIWTIYIMCMYMYIYAYVQMYMYIYMHI